jgi:hypothetical protein
MDKPTRIASQVYGYAVCLVAVITFLISVTGLVNSVADLGDPIHAGYTPQGTPSLASYENYKMDVLKSGQQDAGGNKAGFTPDETALKAMYESAKSDKIQKVRHESNKAIMISTIMILISVVLFITHWRWMQSRAKMQ